MSIERQDVSLGQDFSRSQASRSSRLPIILLALGTIALFSSMTKAGADGEAFYSSYLVSFTFFLTLALGGLFFVLLQFATRAGWSVVVRRVAEHVMGTLPLFALLFVPIALGIHSLYEWSHVDAMEHDALLQAKQAFLNPSGFYLRGAAYLIAWSLIAWWFRSRSLEQDATGDSSITRKLQSLSAPALVIFAVTIGFASFDWLMSLQPHWYSTMFGVYFFAGIAISAFAIVILVSVWLQRRGALPGVVTAEHFHDLGKLLFGFTVFWAYIGFSQYMLIWYANLPEETIFFALRSQNGWGAVTLMLIFGHFLIPFFYLLPQSIKRRPETLAIGALWLLAMHYLDLFWLVKPVFQADGPHFGVNDVLTLVGIGLLFCGCLGLLMRRSALVPFKDPRLPESLTFENM